MSLSFRPPELIVKLIGGSIMNITSDTPVCEIAVAFPTAIPVLERFSLNYCCSGQHTLAEACAERDQFVGPVLEELGRLHHDSASTETDWQTAPSTQLIDHIVGKHHKFSREQLALISDLAVEVERRHGDRHPEIFQVSTAVASVTSELTHHFFCEENLLFPYVAQLEAEETPTLPPMFGSVGQPVTRMILDHEHTGNELRLLREITHDYQLPDDACTTYRALYRALEDLEQDLHEHIHLENNILFPRVLAAAKERQ
ncbi:MAG: iron-sulfur cluster repair di-iron protein [Granulicella sp.]